MRTEMWESQVNAWSSNHTLSPVLGASYPWSLFIFTARGVFPSPFGYVIKMLLDSLSHDDFTIHLSTSLLSDSDGT
jgi:hypothetical protein